MITRIHEVKKLVKQIPGNCKFKFNSTTCNSDQKWDNKSCQYQFKNHRTCMEYYIWNPSRCIRENGKYLKSTADTSVIVCQQMLQTINKFQEY